MAVADSIAEFYAGVQAGATIEYAVASDESLDYPHIVMTYSGGIGEIVSMADAETEVGRVTLMNPTTGEIDEAAARALQDVQSRPFRRWTRAQIASKTESILAEQARLNTVTTKLDLQIQAVRGNSLEAMAERMPLQTIAIGVSKRHIAYSKQIQAINFELYVRDDPSLVTKFGAGAD
jgi:hypothetical protein